MEEMFQNISEWKSIFRTLSYHHNHSDVPGAPSTPVPSDITETSVHLEWSPPSNNGGADITEYIVEQKDRFSSRWTKAGETPGDTVTITLKDLKEGNEYQFRVIAVNPAGPGSPSNACKPFVAKPPYGKKTCDAIIFHSSKEIRNYLIRKNLLFMSLCTLTICSWQSIVALV